jgi:hypothetical protein
LDSLHFSSSSFPGWRFSPFFPLSALSPIAHKHNPARPPSVDCVVLNLVVVVVVVEPRNL